MDSKAISERMQTEWDARARENARHYVATDQHAWTDEEFAKSGRSSVEDMVVADLDRIAGGRDPKTMTMLEIGCGAGRMTLPLAEIFGTVHGIDVSGEMIEQARERLAGIDNVNLHHTNGVDLETLGDVVFDFAMSYIVFQHIPDIEVIRGYIRQAAERLRPGALFKFQVQGSPAVTLAENDTWNGVRFSALDAVEAARSNSLRIEAFEGVGEQYFWLSMRKAERSVGSDKIEQALLEEEAAVTNHALEQAGVELRKLRSWTEEKVAELGRAVSRANELEGELARKNAWADEKLDELQTAVDRAAELEAELIRTQGDYARLDKETSAKIAQLRASLAAVHGSLAVRIGRRIGAAPAPLDEN